MVGKAGKRRGRKPRGVAAREEMKARAKRVRLDLGTLIGSSARVKFEEEIGFDRGGYSTIELSGTDPGLEKLANGYAQHSEVRKRGIDPIALARWVRGGPGEPPLGQGGATIPYTPVQTSDDAERDRDLNAMARDIRDEGRLDGALRATAHDKTKHAAQREGMLWGAMAKLVEMGDGFFYAQRVGDELKTAEVLAEMVTGGLENLRRKTKGIEAK